MKLIDFIAKSCEWNKIAKGSHLHICVKRIKKAGSMLPPGTRINIEESGINKVLFETSFYHINENLTNLIIIVMPKFVCGFSIIITGKSEYNDYVEDIFRECLNQEITE